MKLVLILTVLILFMSVPIFSDGRGNKLLEISSLHIKFDKTDATFIVKYDLGELPRLYIKLLGSKSLVPKVESIFPNFDYKIVKMDHNGAILAVKNISRSDGDYYLHDSRKFGETIRIVRISDSSSTVIKEYHNINATPNYFYK